MRQLGLRRLSDEAWEIMDEKSKSILQAYADGVNDCVYGTNMILKSATSKVLPPEFYAFGITLDNWTPWSPQDSIALVKYKSFYLTWNWMNDLAREALRQKHPDLAEMAEELNPFMNDFLLDHVTIVENEDLIKFGQFDQFTLSDRYHESMDLMREAAPSLSAELPGVKLSKTETAASKRKQAAREEWRKQNQED